MQRWTQLPRGGERGGGACIAELACDADFEYFSTWGSVANVEARINSVINAVNVQFERDVSITHAITTIIVRTAEPDPYTSSDAVTLLNQFRNHWQSNHTGVQRDIAQLFTGKQIDGGTIGIAWISAVCSSYGYSMVESDFNGTGSFACTTDLSAHELGHNWGADHCGCQHGQGDRNQVAGTLHGGATDAQSFLINLKDGLEHQPLIPCASTLTDGHSIERSRPGSAICCIRMQGKLALV